MNTILRRLKGAGVTLRPPAKRRPLQKFGLSREQSAKLRVILDGMLLGDGCITPNGSLTMGQSRNSLEWLQQTQKQLSEAGVPSKIISTKGGHRSTISGRVIISNSGYLLYTPWSTELKRQRERWYPNGEKRVPRDVEITSQSLALWFCGDGSYSKSGTLLFCTNGFLESDVRYLVKKLLAMGIYSSVGYADGLPIIRVNRRNDANRIKLLIQEHVPPCFQYKLKYVREAKQKGFALRKLIPTEVIAIRTKHQEGVSAAELGRFYNVSKVTIGNIVHRRIYKEVP